MFGWLKKRFGRVSLGERQYAYADLLALDLATLRALGARAASDGDAIGPVWVVEAMVELGGECVAPSVAVIDAALGKLPPVALIEMHVTLATCFTSERSVEERAGALRAQLDLARRLVDSGDMAHAEAMLEQAMPAVVSMDTVPEHLALLLLDGARLARTHKWDRAVLALLDRKMALTDRAAHKEICLLLGMALGGTDRAITHLETARSTHPDDVECEFLLGQAHASRARRAGSQSEFEAERARSLEHLDRARSLASGVDSRGAAFPGVVLGAASGVALLALMAPVYDDIMYLEAPLKGAADGNVSTMAE